MSEQKTGGPAFPVQDTWQAHGMTLRDYFAAKAMQGLISCPDWRENAGEDVGMDASDYTASAVHHGRRHAESEGVMSREAMQMALEALVENDNYLGSLDFSKEIAALRQALANEALDKMAENARELGLDYETAKHKDWCIGGDKGPCNCQTEQPADEPVAWANINKQGDITHTQNKKGAWAKTPLYTHPQPAARDNAFEKLAKTVREFATEQRALEQTADEPVAWMSDQDVGFKKSEFGNYPCVPLYTRPQPAAQWVGLGWLPEHKCGLHLSHNEHRDVYETVEQFYEPDSFVSPEEWQKAVAEDSVWVLHWYPETPIGFHRIAASTLEAIEQALKDKNT